MDVAAGETSSDEAEIDMTDAEYETDTDEEHDEAEIDMTGAEYETDTDKEHDEAETEQHHQVNVCSSSCCAERSEPNHPGLTYKSAKHTQDKQSQSLCGVWFKAYPWLSLCDSRLKVFCFYCRNAYLKKLITFSTKADYAFITKGYDNWKKAKARFHSHELSQTHREACMKNKAIEEPSVLAQLS